MAREKESMLSVRLDDLQHKHLVELVGWFYSVSTLFGSFNTELNFKQFNLV